MADLDIKITTRAENTGARETKKAIEEIKGAAGQAAASTAQQNAEVKKTGQAAKEQAKETKNAVEDLGRGSERTGGRLTAMFTKIKVGAAAAVTALLAAKKALDEFGQGEEALIGLEAALRNQGRHTADVVRRYQELAGAMQDVTSIADDKWLAVMEQLTKFGATPENINDLVDGVKNLAAMMNTDIVAAANVFSRFMAGAWSQAREYGIAIDQAGTQTEKMNQLLRQVAERGFGIMEAKGRSLNGVMRTMKNLISDTAESFGQLLVRFPILQWGLAQMAATLRQVIRILPEMDHHVEELGKSAAPAAAGLDDISDAADRAKRSLSEAASAAEELRRRQDELENAQLAEALAKVDYQEAAGLVTPEQAQVARAGLRLDFSQRRTQREGAAIQKEMQTLQALRDDALNKLTELDARAQETAATRDQLLMGVNPDNVDTAIAQAEAQLAANATASPMAKQAARHRIDSLRRGKTAASIAHSAQQDATAARKQFEDIRAQTAPRSAALETQLAVLGHESRAGAMDVATGLQRGGMELTPELIRQLQGSNGPAQMLSELGAAEKARNDEMLQVLRILVRQVNEMRSEVGQVKGQVSNNRNFR